MQPDKSIQNLSELHWVGKNDEQLGAGLTRLLKQFNLGAVGKILKASKTRGICSKKIFLTLFLFPFFGITNILGWVRSGLSEDSDGKKDVYYNLINNSRINWRAIVHHFAKGFAATVKSKSDDQPGDLPGCLVVDDTTLDKTGKKMEFIGKVFDHCSHSYQLGMKVLTLGWWDGKSFIPLDFSIHHEPGKKNDRGLKAREISQQYTKDRPAKCPSLKRIAELSASKIDEAVRMIARALKQGFIPQYVLADSWFITDGFIKSVLALGTRQTGPIHVLGLMKTNRKVEFNGRIYRADSLPGIFRDRIRKCAKLKCQYLSLKVVYQDTPLKVFFVKINGHDSWKLLISTNERSTFMKAMENYQIRWTIEVFFKDAKQSLMLGTCQSNDFDAHIATISLAFMHYIVLALGKRFEGYESMGVMFKAFKDIMLEKTLVQRIWALITGIYQQVLAALGVQWDIFIKLVITNPEVNKLLEGCYAIFTTDKGRPAPKLAYF